MNAISLLMLPIMKKSVVLILYWCVVIACEDAGTISGNDCLDHCQNDKQDCNEKGVDCGGDCDPCWDACYEHCSNGKKDHLEEGEQLNSG